jgi:uncharacterized glyoxalase superfamily protein PhnB
MNLSIGDNFHTSIAPWLTISQDAKAIEFYKSAFAATEVSRYDSPSGEASSASPWRAQSSG